MNPQDNLNQQPQPIQPPVIPPQPVQQFSASPTMPQLGQQQVGQWPAAPVKKSKLPVILAIVGILMLLIGGLAFAFLGKKDDASSKNATTEKAANTSADTKKEDSITATNENGSVDVYTGTDQSVANSKARDVRRRTDINAIFAKLEEYYNNNNGYPDGSLSTVTLPGLEISTLKDEDGALIGYNSGFIVSNTAPNPTVKDTDEYVYAAYGCTKAGAQTPVGATCTKYVLKTFSENDASGSFTKNSLN